MEEPTQVSVDEVKNLLGNKPTSKAPIDLPLNPEDLGIPVTTSEGEQVPEKKTVVAPDATYAEGEAVGKMIADHLKISAVKPHHIEPTPLEKEIFLKALMDDLPTMLEIEVPGVGAKILIRSRSNFEHEMATRATQMDAEEKRLSDSTSYVTRLMQYSAMFQLLKFNGTSIPHVDLKSEDVDLAIAEMRKTLPYYLKSSTRWMIYVTALQIFEGKLAVASSKILNRDFFHPAG